MFIHNVIIGNEIESDTQNIYTAKKWIIRLMLSFWVANFQFRSEYRATRDESRCSSILIHLITFNLLHTT